MRRWYHVVGALVGMLLLCNTAVADTTAGDYVITDFDADYTLSNSDKQGSLRIIENIDVDFVGQKHGILRAIPDTYKKHRLQLQVNRVSSPSGAPSDYSTYGSNGNTVLKIGDPDRTITGSQTYTIEYTLSNVIGFYENHDELYWDINGNAWDAPAKHVSVTLHLPKGITQTSERPMCYTGAYGSTASNCSLQQTEGRLTSTTTISLLPYETLTIFAGFEKGYFQPYTWHDTIGEYAGWIVGFTAPMGLIAGSAGLWWFKRGRDPKGKGTIVPQYDAPDGLKPLEAGTVLDFRTDTRDITATIIDLAIRRYITIIEQKKVRKFRRDITIYLLRLDKTDTTGLMSFEIDILKGIFDTFAKGQEADLSVMRYKLNKTTLQITNDTSKNLKTRGYFTNNPLYAQRGFWANVLVLLFAVGFVFPLVHAHGTIIAGVVAGSIIATIFLTLMASRTARGVAAKEHILGLKMYLETAEADRLAMLQSPDAPYAKHSAGPKMTVHLFEKLLPYAMVLGVEEKWAKQFEHLYVTPPDWYSGNWTTFNAVYLTTTLNSGVRSAVNTAFASPSSSSGSGGSGGGFSGGGGGGGGGGSW